MGINQIEEFCRERATQRVIKDCLTLKEVIKSDPILSKLKINDLKLYQGYGHTNNDILRFTIDNGQTSIKVSDNDKENTNFEEIIKNLTKEYISLELSRLEQASVLLDKKDEEQKEYFNTPMNNVIVNNQTKSKTLFNKILGKWKRH